MNKHPHSFIMDLQEAMERIRAKSQYFGNSLPEVNARLNWITNYAMAQGAKIERWLKEETERKD